MKKFRDEVAVPSPEQRAKIDAEKIAVLNQSLAFAYDDLRRLAILMAMVDNTNAEAEYVVTRAQTFLKYLRGES